MRRICILFYLVGLVVSLQTKINKHDIDIGKSMTKVVHRYFSRFQCVFVISESEEDGFLSNLQLPPWVTLVRVLAGEDLRSVLFSSTVKDILKTSFEEACKGFIVQLSKPRYFLTFWKDVVRTSLHRHNPRILFLPTSKNNNVSSEVLESKLTEYITDMTMVDMFISEDSKRMLQFVTAGWNNTRNVLATCEVSCCLFTDVNLYPNKIADLQSKDLRVATFSYLPYAIMEPLDGTEVRIAQEFARRHNCTVQVVTDDAQWGQIFDNGTGDGILGNVAEERADLGLGALYLWYHEYQFLDFSLPYIRTGITCLAPKPKLLPAVLLLVRPFTALTWLIVACVLLTASAALFLTKKLDTLITGGPNKEQNKRHNRWFTTTADTVLRTFGFLVMQGSSNRLIEVSSIRHLVNWLHVMFLLVATSYNSGLASILTVPSYLPPIDSVPDLVHSQLGWGATHDAWVFSLREATDPDMKALVDRFQALPGDRLHTLTLHENFAFSVERLPAGHFAVGDYITLESMDHLRLMKEDIYYEYCTIVFQKGSPYTESFNQLIHRLLTSGLLLFWEGEVTRKFLHSSLQSAVKDSTMSLYEDRLAAVRVSHLQGAFFVLAAGLLLALLSFLVELYLGRSRGGCLNTWGSRPKGTWRKKGYRGKDMTQYGFFF